MSDFAFQDDDLVSAFVDGELSPQQAEEVRGDERLRARAAQFAAVRDELAQSQPILPDSQRERLLKTALAAFDQQTQQAAQPSRAGATVIRLRSFPAPILAAAAALILIAGLAIAGLLSRSGGGDVADVATETVVTSAAAAPADDSGTREAGAADSFAAIAEDDSMFDADEASDYMMEDSGPDELKADDPARAEADMAADTDMADDDDMDADTDMANDDDMDADTDMANDDDMSADHDADGAAEDGAFHETDDAESEPVPTVTVADGGDADDEPSGGVESSALAVDLGVLDGIEMLWDRLDASAVQEDPPLVEPGECSAALEDFATSLGAAIRWSFAATISNEPSSVLDAVSGELPDGSAFAAYAQAPDCMPVQRSEPGAAESQSSG